jgi:hypothetical protein
MVRVKYVAVPENIQPCLQHEASSDEKGEWLKGVGGRESRGKGHITRT